MDIRILGKNLSVTEGMKDHLSDKLVKFEKYAPRLVESHVVLKKEKYFYVAEVTLLAKNFRAYGDGRSKENIFTAMDDACLRVEKQLKKFREKIKKHHGKLEKPGSLSASNAEEDPLSVLPPLPKPKIIKTNHFSGKPMLPEEASMQLTLAKENFVVFLNPKTEKISVIYKRKDGHHGLIEPEF